MRGTEERHKKQGRGTQRKTVEVIMLSITGRSIKMKTAKSSLCLPRRGLFARALSVQLGEEPDDSG